MANQQVCYFNSKNMKNQDFLAAERTGDLSILTDNKKKIILTEYGLGNKFVWLVRNYLSSSSVS